MSTVTMKPAQLKSICLFAARSDVRYYLIGVYFNMHRGNLLAVASDGHRLGAMMLEGEAVEKNVIIPLELLDWVTNTKKSGPVIIEISQDGMVEVSQGGMTRKGQIIDANYPNYERIIPRSTTGEAGLYQGKHLADYDKVAGYLGAGSECNISVANNGESIAIVRIAEIDYFFGAIMPYRTPCDAVLPSWY